MNVDETSETEPKVGIKIKRQIARWDRDCPDVSAIFAKDKKVLKPEATASQGSFFFAPHLKN